MIGPHASGCLRLLGLVAALTACAEPQEAVRAKARAPALDWFPIVVWTQPAAKVRFWSRLGVNTIVNGEAHTTESQRIAFLDECVRHGVRGCLAIKAYSARLDAHPGLALWRVRDEPDMVSEKTQEPRLPPRELAEQIAQLPETRTRPIWLNTTARFFGHYRDERVAEDVYRRYFDLVDIAGFDHYPVTGWNRPDRLHELDDVTRRCRELTSRPLIVIVEASDQKLSWTPPGTRGPTASEVRAEVLLALIGGARGIGYFPLRLRPFEFEDMTGEVRREVQRTNLQLAKLQRYFVRLPPPRVRVSCASKLVRCGVRQDESGRLLLVVVNLGEKQVRAELRLSGAPRAESFRGLTSGQQHRVQRSRLALECAPLGAYLLEEQRD